MYAEPEHSGHRRGELKGIDRTVTGRHTPREALYACASLLFMSLVVSLGALLLPSAALADSRCSGSKGYQVYENINYGGRTAISCVNRADYSGWQDNLNFWESWNDAVSSAVSFNATGWNVNFYQNANYNHFLLQFQGNVAVSDFRNWGANDQVSSSAFS